MAEKYIPKNPLEYLEFRLMVLERWANSLGHMGIHAPRCAILHDPKETPCKKEVDGMPQPID